KVLQTTIDQQPIIIPAGKPKVISPSLIIHEIRETLTAIPVNEHSLKTFTPGVDSSSYVLINSTGDTVRTNVPLHIAGKIMPCIQPRPIKALPLHMIDHSSRNIKYLDRDQGMSSNSISCIFEDSYGNLWFGTFGGGVSKYNGYSFMHFTEEEGLSNNVVRSIHEDNHGNLWFGTHGGGISMYNGETFTYYTEKEGLINNMIYSIAEDSSGNLWFGTQGGVSKFNGSTFTHFTEEEGLCNNIVRSIHEDNHGNLWFGTERGGISMYNGETFTHFTENEGLLSNTIYSIAEDSYGDLWFATGDGINMYDGHAITDFSEITESKELNYNTVVSTLEDSNGNLWFGTYGGGVSMYNGETFTHLTENEGLSNNYVTSILEDSYGNLWFGTNGGGVNLYNVSSFTPYADIEDLSNNTVTSILEDSQGNLWFGTGDGGVLIHDGKTYKHITEKEGLRFNGVYTILEDSRDNIWFSYRWGRGVSMFNGKTYTTFTGVGLYHNHVLATLEDDKGNLWFTKTDRGIIKYNGEIFTDFTEKEGLSQNTITSILQDIKGNLWFGTYERGVSKYDGNYITHFTEKEGLVNNYVLSIFEDSHGNLWIGTEGGLSIYNGETFTQFTKKEGLSGRAVMSILEDNNNNIWIGTDNGLNYFSFSRDSEKVPYNSPVIYTYKKADGLRGIEFYDHCAILDKKNRIWWGSDKGLTMLDMNKFNTPVEPPSIQLNQIDINEQIVDYRHLKNNDEMGLKFNGVAKFNNYPLNLELPFNRNHLTFHFSAIDWAAPEKIRYSFKMEGLNDNWSQLTEEPKADYRNLPNGIFTFKVCAIGIAGKWSEPYEYTFKILPPFWHTLWARSGYGIIAVIIVILIIHWRTKRLKKRQKELESDIGIATQNIYKQNIQILELDSLKTRFFNNISHEFRTLASLIKIPAEYIMKEEKLSSKGRRELEVIYRNTNRLLKMVTQLLDISRIDKRAMKLILQKENIFDFTHSVAVSFASLAESRGIQYRYYLPRTEAVDWIDVDKIEKIISNLLSNAFKFTDEGGKVRIDMVYKNRHNGMENALEISVSDTGKGVPEEEQGKIFDRFYQTEVNLKKEGEGTGIGLALTNDLVDLMHGSINVKSEVGSGSTFTVLIPMGIDHLEENEYTISATDREVKIDVPETTWTGGMYADDLEKDKKQKKDSSNRPQLLVVEDNADILWLIGNKLRKEFEVFEAVDGSAGLKIAIENLPDLVITDLMMPRMDGFDLCTKLKTDLRTSHIPVIMLTAKATMDDKLQGLETGADDYITKPFDIQEVLVRVRNLIDQRRKLREQFSSEFILEPRDIVITSVDEDFLTQAMNVVETHMEDDTFDVSHFCKEMSMSRSTLYRKLDALTNQSPVGFINVLRIKRAASLLKQNFGNVTQVAFEVGFSNPSYFAKLFKETYSLTPSEYIKS
ncbi:MAG: two-component regulator propeller domain-containing protein, partial [Bacteroidota bacterium]